MSDERNRNGSGASAAIVIVLVLCGLLGLLVVGGGAAFSFFRVSGTRQMEMMESRARAEMMAVQMHAEKARLEAQLAAQTPPVAEPMPDAKVPELLLEINAAGDYKLAGKAMEYYDDLKTALLTAHFEQGAELQVVISADRETRFDRVSKAVEAAECAGITKHRILTPSSPPVTDPAAELSAQPGN
jgi:biopolymer transport protein ExbD